MRLVDAEERGDARDKEEDGHDHMEREAGTHMRCFFLKHGKSGKDIGGNPTPELKPAQETHVARYSLLVSSF